MGQEPSWEQVMISMYYLDNNRDWLMPGPPMYVCESLLFNHMAPLLSHARAWEVSAVIKFFINTEETLHWLRFLLQFLNYNRAVA